VPARAHKLWGWLAKEIMTLDPGAFAIVMATGIVSNAFLLQVSVQLSAVLFAVGLAAYCGLLVLSLLRCAWLRRAVWADLTDPRLVFLFFTFVAGTDVLGSGVSLRGYDRAALGLWLLAALAWLALIYFSLAVLTFFNTDRGVDIVQSGWLLAIVGTESLVILGAAVAPMLGRLSPTAFVLLHMLWAIGLVLYGIFISLFSQRVFFTALTPDKVTPSWWIVMGAAAISVNAGSTLVAASSGIAFLESMRPFIDAVTLVLWAWATWWIPFLLILGIWKHAVCRLPLVYTPALWSVVFPLGMYSVATLRLSLTAEFAPLRLLSYAMAWIALAAWVLIAAGLVVATWRSLQPSRRQA